ncbi:MAG: efflux RND transporter periplasmic adaptor subunit [Alphaproteobacteria bacterium]|nr:efflux RND transporter periplasmic adaptor subunit [Alphaproteobacteria bacterium]
MNKKLIAAVAGVAIVVVGGFAVAATSGSGGKTGAYAFDTATVERGDVSRVISASGAVQPLTKVDVGSEVSGKIVKLNVDFNSKVKKDEVLAVVDPSSFQSTVDQAKAALLQSKAQVANAKSSIEHSKVALDIAEKNWKRQKTLYDQQAISQQAWEQADQTYKFAQLQLDSDNVSLQSANAGLARSQATLDDALVKLGKTQIRSPIDGVVISRAVDVGQTVQSSMTVAKFFTIAEDLSQIQIEASVVESDIGGIDPGDPATFTVDAFPGERFQGQVTQVRQLGAEQANVVTYTVIVRAQNRGGKLLPGMTANAEITADRAENVLRIANDATRFQPPRELQQALGANKSGQPSGAQGGAQAVSMAGGPGGAPGAGGGQRGGRGGFGNPSSEWLKEIGVDDARVQKISAEMQSEMEKVRASIQRPQQGNQPLGGGGFGPPASIMQQQAMQQMRTKMQQTMDAVMKRNLTSDEFDAFSAKRAEAQSQKRVVAYTVDAKGALERHMLTLGVSDGNYSVIVRGAKEGDKFVTKARPAGGSKKAKVADAPPAGQSPLTPSSLGRSVRNG